MNEHLHPNQDQIGAWLAQELAALLEVAPQAIRTDEPLADLGLASREIVGLLGQLERWLGRELDTTLAWRYPTIDALARHLAGQDPEPAPAAAPAPGSAGAAEPIAIVGMACRFPGADDVDELWALLREGRDAIDLVPPERWDSERLYHPEPGRPGRLNTRWGGFLARVEEFDARFFGISPREGSRMDPQQRLLLELAWEALEHAGLAPGALAGSQTGVFIGIATHDYERFQLGRLDAIDAYAGTGTAQSIAANRISYVFDLQGPSIAVDTACSSSLVAIHLACQSLREGACSAALVGGVNLILRPELTVSFSSGGFMAPQGRCRAFDEGAEGYVRSEGAGLVVLKPLAAARADGDRVLAVILGSAVNQDGRSNGLTAPNGLAQQAVIRQALDRAGVRPAQVGYVETHGTGTPLGDPIEVAALVAALGAGRTPDQTCALGSIKANIGHTEAAAGIAGLIKTVLCLVHGALPGNLHLRQLNPSIALAGTPFRIDAEARSWDAGRERIAGVSSFGFGGTNAHVVLHEAPRGAPPAAPPEGPQLLPLSAKTPQALRALAESYQRWLSQTSAPLAHICHTAGARRSHHEHRLALVGATPAALAQQLQALLQQDGAELGAVPGAQPPRPVLIFPGQGGQWVGMGRELIEREPVFRASMEACAAAMRPLVDWHLLDVIAADDETLFGEEIDILQPTLFALQVSLAALWRAWGLRPAAVVGHSLGEVAAAHVAGALSLEDACLVICRRSRLLRRIRGQGAMALVELSREEAEAALAPHAARLSVAVCNGPRSTVLAGDGAALQELLPQLEARGIFSRWIKVNVASHSPQVDELTAPLLEALAPIRPQPASIPFLSTVSLQPVAGPELDATYWARNLRQPVLFGDAIQQLLGQGLETFIEIGPHPILLPALEQICAEGDHAVTLLPSLRRERELDTLRESLASLYARGADIAWTAVAPPGEVVALPRYPWQRQRLWLPDELGPLELAVGPGPSGATSHLLGGAGRAPAPGEARYWSGTVELAQLPYLADHQVGTTPVLPAAASVELALAALAEGWGPATPTLEALSFAQLLPLDAAAPTALQLVCAGPDADRVRFEILARDDGSGGHWRHYAAGTLRITPERALPETTEVRPQALMQRLRRRAVDEHYRTLAQVGLCYGPAFQPIVELWVGEREALARLEPGAGQPELRAQLHPVLLDGCFQALGAALADEGALDAAHLPVALDQLQLLVPEAGPGPFWAHARLRPPAESAGDRSGDLVLLDDQGQTIALVAGLRLRPARATLARPEQPGLEGWLYELRWRDEPLAVGPAPASPPGATWIIIGEEEAGTALRTGLEARSRACVQIGSAELADAGAAQERLVALLAAAPQPCAGIVYLLPATLHEQALTPAGLERAAEQTCSAPLRLVQALARLGRRDQPRLWLVSAGAQRVLTSDAVPGLDQAPLWGLGRAIAYEHPELRCSLVDLSPAPGPEEYEALAVELLADAPATQLALRGRARLIAQLDGWQARTGADEAVPAGERAFRLQTRRPGDLDQLRLHQVERRQPGPGEVEVEVRAAGLNFLDVLMALGTYPDDVEDPGLRLGGECAGVITAVGPGVVGLALGDAVVAIAPGSMGTHVVIPAALVSPKPPGLDFPTAAALPIAYVTAHYALCVLGRLQPGERVLIHAASGGVGLAAIQLAQRIGAEVYATAGSEEKRAHLRALGVACVLDSRTLHFRDEILAHTGGVGVDLVLNTLAGQAIAHSMAVLAPYGRFVEIGKRDIYEHGRLDLRPFLRNLSYSAVNLARMVEERPQLVGAMLSELAGRVASGELRVPAPQVYPLDEAPAIFRQMAQARHIGKLVFTLERRAEHRLIPTRSQAATPSPAGTYLITGGLGGLGLTVAGTLVDRGARHVALLGRRRVIDTAAQSQIAALRARGASVLVLQGDVSRGEDLRRVLAQIDETMPPLAGVVHAAGVLDDGILLQLTPERFQAVLAPKVQGAWNLHQQTAGRPLELFVLFSSAAALLGSPGQGNYAAANAFLDALAHYRRARGLPGMAINWGPWAEVGMVAAPMARRGEQGLGGVQAITPEQGAWLFLQLLQAGPAQAAAMRFDARQWRQSHPQSAGWPIFAALAEAETPAAGPNDWNERLQGLAPAARREALEGHLCAQVTHLLRLPPGQVDAETPLSALGFDSLVALELRNRLEHSFGVRLSATLIWNYNTVALLAAHIAEKLALPLEEPARAPAPEVSPPQALDSFSAEEREALADLLGQLLEGT